MEVSTEVPKETKNTSVIGHSYTTFGCLCKVLQINPSQRNLHTDIYCCIIHNHCYGISQVFQQQRNGERKRGS